MNRLTPQALCIVLLLVSALAPASGAAPYHGASYGYNLSLPDDWKQIPSEDLARLARTVTNPNARKSVVYDAAFQPAANAVSFTYPYMMVQVLPYANVGVNRQVREDEFPGIVKAITGVDLKKAVDSQLSPKARSVLGGAGFGQSQLDSARHRFTVPLNMSVKGIGNVKGQVTGYFGHDALVQVAVYTLDGDPGDAQFQQITDSFHFDPDAEFVPTPPSPLQRLLKDHSPAELAGMVVGVAICVGIFFYIMSRNRNKTA